LVQLVTEIAVTSEIGDEVRVRKMIAMEIPATGAPGDKRGWGLQVDGWFFHRSPFVYPLVKHGEALFITHFLSSQVWPIATFWGKSKCVDGDGGRDCKIVPVTCRKRVWGIWDSTWFNNNSKLSSEFLVIGPLVVARWWHTQIYQQLFIYSWSDMMCIGM